MAWVKIDELFYDHPKWATAPGDSVALWLAAMAWCNRNDSLDGFIPAIKLNGLVNVRNVKRTAADLVDREAFHLDQRLGIDGYLIHDYAEYQQPEKVRDIAAKRSAAGKKGALTRWGERDRAADYNRAPPPPETQALDMTDDIANAIDSDSKCHSNEMPRSPLPVNCVQSSSETYVVGDPQPVDDDDFAAAIEFIVDARCHGRPIDNERSYRQAVRREAIDLDGPLVRRELARGHGPEQTARCVLGAWPSDKPTSTPVAWCPPDCPTCDGTAFVDTGNGYAPCPERTAA